MPSKILQIRMETTGCISENLPALQAISYSKERLYFSLVKTYEGRSS